MIARVMSTEDLRNDWPAIVGNVTTGGTVLVEQANKPVAAIIAFEDYLALKEQLEDLQDARVADIAYEEHLRDPSGARPLDELMAEWDAKDAERAKAKR